MNRNFDYKIQWVKLTLHSQLYIVIRLKFLISGESMYLDHMIISAGTDQSTNVRIQQRWIDIWGWTSTCWSCHSTAAPPRDQKKRPSGASVTYGTVRCPLLNHAKPIWWFWWNRGTNSHHSFDLDFLWNKPTNFGYPHFRKSPFASQMIQTAALKHRCRFLLVQPRCAGRIPLNLGSDFCWLS